VALALRLLPSEETERVLIFYLYSVGRRGTGGNIRTFQTAAVRKLHEIEILLQFIPKTFVLICSSHSHKRIIHRESRSASCSGLRRLNSSTLAHDLSIHVWKLWKSSLKLFAVAVCSLSNSWVCMSIKCDSYWCLLLSLMALLRWN